MAGNLHVPLTPEAAESIFCHALKHPMKPAMGVLLGTNDGNHEYRITAAFPTSHNHAFLGSASQITLNLLTAYREHPDSNSGDSRIIGVYSFTTEDSIERTNRGKLCDQSLHELVVGVAKCNDDRCLLLIGNVEDLSFKAIECNGDTKHWSDQQAITINLDDKVRKHLTTQAFPNLASSTMCNDVEEFLIHPNATSYGGDELLCVQTAGRSV